MSARYLIRLDDITAHMAWGNFRRLERAFDEFGIKPLLGVIPDNHDPELKQFPECSGDFWAEMRELQERGWEMAQHGFRHVYVTRDCGLMGVNNLSEFAGLPYAEQFDKLARGQSLLCERGLRSETFMAPSHSFDVVTLRALKDLGFTTVTDGFAPFPYVAEGLIFLPQWLASPRVMPIGVQTFCLHINGMSERAIENVERFLAAHHREFLTFPEARALATPHTLNRIAGSVMRTAIRGVRAWRFRRRMKAA
jgi:peptidoglycan/xylan/chitin deacetylase (PgdA/CDA1 family)